jgi:hypothetical protein
MPPVILWALGALGAAAAGRWVFKESRRINDELHADDQPVSVDERDTVAKLERDPETGIYRPK